MPFSTRRFGTAGCSSSSACARRPPPPAPSAPAWGCPLFVNIEPQAIEADDLCVLSRTAAAFGGATPLILEITERALTSRPAELIDLLARARGLGLGIALDDVGVDARSLALLPIVRPDVVKLDRRLIHGPPSAGSATVLTAVAAACESTGAIILAEGVETERHRRTRRPPGRRSARDTSSVVPGGFLPVSSATGGHLGSPSCGSYPRMRRRTR